MEERPKRIIEQERQLGNMPNFFCVKRQHKIVPRSILPGTEKKCNLGPLFRGRKADFFVFVTVFNHLVAQNEAYKFVESDVLRDFPPAGNQIRRRHLDTDMAKEMMNYTKMNVLVQSAQAMLAQANQQPQSVLQLLQ